MKHKIYLYFFLLFSTLNISAFSSTDVPASITTDTQWDASGSPYLIQGKVVLAKGATLHIGPSVQVLFKGPSSLEVNGTMNAEGSAAAPVVFTMTEGGLQSELFINGGTADITNTKILSGVFLVQDSQLHLQWFEITKGSGLYLRGNTTANVANGKIYGNATGVVLDGQVNLTMEFNTLTQNTYGIFLKKFTNLDCTNNSIHDNDKEVVNNSTSVNLGNNYWGNSDEKTVQAKTQGAVSLTPLKTLKEVLRIYIRTQLPLITKQMELALKTQEKKEKKEKLAALARQKLQKAKAVPFVSTEAPKVKAPAPLAEKAAPETTPLASETVETEAPTGSMAVKIKELPPTPHTLKPLDNLPPDQGNVAEEPAVVPSAAAENQSTAAPSSPSFTSQPSVTAPVANPSSVTVPTAAVISTVPPASNASTSPALPPPPVENTAATNPPSVPSNINSTSPPSLPNSDITLLPPPPVVGNPAISNPGASATSSSTIPPVPSLPTASAPPAIPNSEMTLPPPPVVENSTTSTPASPSSSSITVPPVPQAGDIIAPPSIQNSTTPPSTTSQSILTSPAVPPPPDLTEQITPALPPPTSSNSNTATSTDVSVPPVPAPPASSSDTNLNTPPPAIAAQPVPVIQQPPQVPTVNTEQQQKAVQSLDGVGGDIDGMQAPPLDLGPDLSNPATVTGSANSNSTASPASSNPAGDSSLALPPLKEGDVQPPKDLDLPPTDDLGNVNH